MTEPQGPEELPSEMISHKIRPGWEREVIEEVERLGVPKGTIRERMKPKPYPSYVACMCNLVDKGPMFFEEEMKKKEWVYAMVDEYQ